MLIIAMVIGYSEYSQSLTYTIEVAAILILWIWIMSKLELHYRKKAWRKNLPKPDNSGEEEISTNTIKTLHIVKQIYDSDGEIILTGVIVTHIPIPYVLLFNLQPNHIRASWVDSGRLFIHGCWNFYMFHSYKSYLLFHFSHALTYGKTIKLSIDGLKEANLFDRLLDTVSCKL